MDAPDRTDLSCFTSPLALPQILVRAARRISSPRDTGVRPKPIAMESPSTQKASSPGKTKPRGEGGQEPPGVVEGGEEAGAERGMDVAARHGDYPCEHAAARLVDGPRVGPPARAEPGRAGGHLS